MSDQGDSMRASDAEREAVAERLRLAMSEGRLDINEYDERLRGLYASSTQAELARFTDDLPAPQPPAPDPEVEKKERQRKKWLKSWRDWAGTAFILVAIWAVTSIVTGEMLSFWPVIPMGIWAAILFADRIFGNDDKDDDKDDEKGKDRKKD